MKSRKATKKKRVKHVSRMRLSENIKAARTKKPFVMDTSDESAAEREQHKAWAAILSNPRKKALHNAASNGIYKTFHNSLVYYFMKKIGTNANLDDIKDLTMQTLEKAFSKIKSYKPESAALSTWIFRIALNCLIDLKRSAKSIDVVSVESINHHNVRTMGEADAEFFELSSESLSPIDSTDRIQRHSLVRKAIDGLQNDSMRRMVMLRFLDECSYEEIAEQMNIPMGTVKANLFRAKELLKGVLIEKLEMEKA